MAAGVLPCESRAVPQPCPPPPLPGPPRPCCRPLQERQTLEEAEGLLKKLGFTGSLFQGAPPPQPDEEEGEAGAGEEEE